MTQIFEGLVRPFQNPSNAPPQRYLTPGQQSVPPVLLQIGRTGGGKTMNGNYAAQTSYYCDQQVVEKSS